MWAHVECEETWKMAFHSPETRPIQLSFPHYFFFFFLSLGFCFFFSWCFITKVPRSSSAFIQLKCMYQMVQIAQYISILYPCQKTGRLLQFLVAAPHGIIGWLRRVTLLDNE